MSKLDLTNVQHELVVNAPGLSPQRVRRRWPQGAQGWTFVLPPMIIYGLFVLIPLVRSLYISFTDWNGVRPDMNWIGFSNYIQIFHDPRFLTALSHNIIWVIVGTIAPIVISLGLAMLLWPHTRGRTVFQVAYFLPHILSSVAIALIWARVYHPLSGILNGLLKAVGLGHLATGWLGESNTALAAVLVAAIWAYFGFALTIIMAGLQTINMELIDAAKVDGANSWQRFIHIIIPELRYVLTMIFSYTLIGGFNVFDIVWVMTQGGPGTSTQVVSTLLYREAFIEGDVSYGASMAVVLSLISFVISAIFITLRERKD
ncbi:MAG: sugar ABC transporter permease [Anaerolineae bacterium]|nr:sugar ABC transporter permease [Anaerolineae bacterium]